jgi:hypothetical protein
VATRARWSSGILIALVIGLVVGLIIVLGDNKSNNSSTPVPIQSITMPTVPTPTIAPTTTQSTTTTGPNGGTPIPSPGDTSTPAGL